MKRLIAVLITMLIALLAFELVDWHLRVLALLPWPAELIHPDGVCVYHARNVMEGKPLYTDWQEPPYVVAPYGPLFYWCAGMLGRALGSDTFGLFVVGRWISLIASWGTALLIVVVSWRRHRVGWAAGVVAGSMFLLATVNYPTAVAFRPDAPAVLFSMLGIVIAEQWTARPRGLLSLGPFLIAFLYKQSFVAGPMAVILFCWAHRRYRDGLIYAVATGVVFGGTVVVMQVLTAGGYWLNCFEGLWALRNWDNILSVVGPIAIRNFPLLLLATAVLISEVIQRRPSLWAVMFGTSASLAVIATVRVGSAANYFIECCAVACVLVAPLLRWPYGVAGATQRAATGQAGIEGARDRTPPVWSRERGAWVVCGLLAVLVVDHGIRTWQITRQLPVTVTEFAGRYAAAREARRRIVDTARWIDELSRGKPVICLDASLAIHLSTDPVVMDPFLISGLCDLDKFRDERNVAEKIRGGFYGAIVLDYRHAYEREGAYYQDTPVFPRAWMAALRAGQPPRYRLAGSPRGLMELGVAGPTKTPARYRHYGSPKPFIDVYVPVE